MIDKINNLNYPILRADAPVQRIVEKINEIIEYLNSATKQP